MVNLFYQQSLLNVKALSRDDLERLFKLAAAYKNQQIHHKPLRDKVMAICFFEASTRTRFSFESAVLRLGGQMISLADPKSSSQQKGESLQDTLKVMAGYVDGMIIRHSCEGAARLAADVTGIPVINAGDGANQHPTQTLLDLFTMQETQGRLDGLHVAIVGDLKYGRTTHSLVQAASLFDMRLYFIVPRAFVLPEELTFELKKKGIIFSFHQSIAEVIHKVDILYLTRFQKERLSESERAEKTYQAVMLTADVLKEAQPHLKILHPLPRQEELTSDIDHFSQAYYFQQAQNGLYVRQALLHAIFCEDLS